MRCRARRIRTTRSSGRRLQFVSTLDESHVILQEIVFSISPLFIAQRCSRKSAVYHSNRSSPLRRPALLTNHSHTSAIALLNKPISNAILHPLPCERSGATRCGGRFAVIVRTRWCSTVLPRGTNLWVQHFQMMIVRTNQSGYCDSCCFQNNHSFVGLHLSESYPF